MTSVIERFNQQAVKHNLSAGAILLWQYLYFTMQRQNQFADVQQNTSVLTAMLNVSRQGLQLMRRSLTDNGLLAVHVDEHQVTFYTLMIDGKVVGEKAAQKDTAPGERTEAAGLPQASPLCHALCTASTEGRGSDNPVFCTSKRSPQESGQARGQIEREPSGDIILTNKFHPYIDQFCDRFGDEVKQDLLAWAEMRRNNGWTLTLWGLEAAFKKLIELSGGDVLQMGRIAAQSVKMRWKGFWEVKVKPKPSGAKLRALEAQEAGTTAVQETQIVYKKPWQKTVPAPKFKPEGRDLSFLER